MRAVSLESAHRDTALFTRYYHHAAPFRRGALRAIWSRCPGSTCAFDQARVEETLGALADDQGVVADDLAGFALELAAWGGGDELMNLVRSGEVVASMAWDTGGWKLNDDNADITFVAPASGALGWIDTFAIPAKAKNVDAAYKWINFMLRPENAAEFTNMEKYGTASKGAIELTNPDIRGNFERCFPQAAIDNVKWYPPVPAKLEEIEGKILDKVKAAS